jgi:hypothetical protein
VFERIEACVELIHAVTLLCGIDGDWGGSDVRGMARV